jgi:hypothetical protein
MAAAQRHGPPRPLLYSPSMGEARCHDCGLALPMKPPPVDPCPRCGSVRRDGTVRAGVARGTGAAGSPESRAREPDLRYKRGRLSKPARESRVGMSPTRDDGVERSRRRTYDRLNHKYEETILNPDGSIHHHTSEDLREHRDRGSARRRVTAPGPDQRSQFDAPPDED